MVDGREEVIRFLPLKMTHVIGLLRHWSRLKLYCLYCTLFSVKFFPLDATDGSRTLLGAFASASSVAVVSGDPWSEDVRRVL